MFRIDRIAENTQFELWKIAGEIHDTQLEAWKEALPTDSGRQLILDFCEVAYISPSAVRHLIERMTANLFIYNCQAGVKNMMHSAGFARQVLG